MDDNTFKKMAQALIPSVSPEDAFESGFSGWLYQGKGAKADLFLADVELVQARGGSEGDGERVWLVFKVTRKEDGKEFFFKKEGYYSSYDGTDWDGSFYEVFPEQKYVTEYSAR